MISYALLCSGQGAQTPDLFQQFPFTSIGIDLKQRIIESGSLSPDVAAWLQNPTAQPNLIYRDHYAQPLLCLFQAMAWAEISHQLPTPRLVTGYSLGELSAYGCARALCPEDIVKLATIRATLMDAAAQPGALIAVTGMTLAIATQTAEQHGGYVAIVIGEDHCVLGCLAENASALASALKSTARSVTTLPVTIASHTPLLDSAVEPFRNALLACNYSPIQMPIIAGVNASKISSREQMGQWLPEQIHRTVRWDFVLARLRESDCRVVLELGPGNQLAHIALAEKSAEEARAISEFHSVDGIVSWVEKALKRTSSL